LKSSSKPYGSQSANINKNQINSLQSDKIKDKALINDFKDNNELDSGKIIQHNYNLNKNLN